MINKQHLIADEGNLNQSGRLMLCLGEMANTLCYTAVDPTTEAHTSLRNIKTIDLNISEENHSSSTMSYFSSVGQEPPIEFFALRKAYQEDNFPDKVDLGLGDRNGPKTRNEYHRDCTTGSLLRSTVVSIHAKWINDGDTGSRRQGVGRPRVIKGKRRRRLSRLVKQNRRQTVAQLTAQYNAGPSASVSEHTVQRTLLDMGLCSRRPTCVSLLTKRHHQPRLQWAREHRDWTIDEWKRVAWSEESRFLIHHVDGRVRVRRLPGEQLLPSCTAGHTQAGGGGIMLWGTFSWAALGPVVVVEQTMKAANYLNIAADQLHLYIAFVFPTGNGIFQ
ncbi:Transposable element Tc1 transposase [Araneus ventricosus]|uniref:Transposable element Tc1 transposase n=1 Tax=Araneus ventricosus TaxID=182803 RepID=A0A4Y2TP83_ARAVE|nr:Transposable element Tc1 transposase [Araneus ventricosus]